jgi:hypothetical protein
LNRKLVPNQDISETPYLLSLDFRNRSRRGELFLPLRTAQRLAGRRLHAAEYVSFFFKVGIGISNEAPVLEASILCSLMID